MSAIAKIHVLAILTGISLIVSACDDDPGPRVDKCGDGCLPGKYPCPCADDMECAGDEQICGKIHPDHLTGFCTKPCSSDSDCELDKECTARGKCILTSSTLPDTHCAYVCSYDEECPLSMVCVSSNGISVCY